VVVRELHHCKICGTGESGNWLAFLISARSCKRPLRRIFPFPP